jgi:uncharacterized protein YfaS (alpha-2-macroglobulin family)
MQIVAAQARTILVVLLLLGGTVLAGYGLYQWWESRPRPEMIFVTVQPVPISKVTEEGLVPQPLVVEFGGSVARLEMIGKPVTTGLTLQPVCAGVWKWVNDRRLTFEPKKDWPAGSRYVLTFEPSLFPKTVELERYRAEFTTPPLWVSIKEEELYINPKNPELKQVTATLSFTHPVTEATVRAHLDFTGQQRDELLARSTSEPLYQIELADHGRLAYFRSAPVHLPRKPAFLTLHVSPGLITTNGGEPSVTPENAEIRIPDLYNLLHVEASDLAIVRNSENEPEQILILQTASEVAPAELGRHLEIYLLPKNKPAALNQKVETDYAWASPAEIGDEILARSEQVKWSALPTDKDFDKVHSFRLEAPENRYLYIKVTGGLTGLGGFVMQDPYATVAAVQPFPREVHVMHDGAVLALSGERKLSILTRGVTEIETRLGKVAAHQINHLVSQSEGNFQNPVFFNYTFGEDNVSEVFERRLKTGGSPTGRTQYVAVDFDEYLSSKITQTRYGLFFLRVGEARPLPVQLAEAGRVAPPEYSSQWANRPADQSQVSDQRFLLVTDLGLIVKDNAAGTHDVFVQSLKTGRPVADATVEVLGKNGLPVATSRTDENGRASLPEVRLLRHEKAPVAFVVRKGEDLSFLPFSRRDRVLNFSRYNVGGLELPKPNTLTAFVFSDRGLYRPGDEMNLGFVLKSFDWRAVPENLPLSVSVIDPRGQIAASQRLKNPADGLLTWKFTPAASAPTGTYQVRLQILHSGQAPDEQLGSTTVKVEEFLPDRLKIQAKLTRFSPEGWIHPDELQIAAHLQNLYGTPAAGHRINGQMALTPSGLGFARYPAHVFYDPLAAKASERRYFKNDLAEAQTNEAGDVLLPLPLGAFDQGAYRLNYVVRGFEREGGRNVSTEGSALVSARPFLIGSKTDTDLASLRPQSAHQVHWLAVQPDLKPCEVKNLTLKLTEERYVSILTKRPDGKYAYESVGKELEVTGQTVALAETGFTYTLPTQKPGEYIARLSDETGLCLSVLRFGVTGNANTTRSLEKNAELMVKIPTQEFKPGDEIPLSITAPYIGSGLITIERDKVYAQAWFQTKTTGSIQKIRIPKDFDGNGYLNVSFVRALDSKEIFMSPLSTAVVPFQVSRETHTLKIDLQVPEQARPGRALNISYATDRPARLVIFAVDEGILQVAKYATPDPLEHFLQKRALQVKTSQMLDLLLPEYSVVKEVAAAGGDGDADMLSANLNPFKRKSEKPVVFWSGVLTSGPKPRQLTYQVPDYFNGTLRLMAVAVNDERAGTVEKKTILQSPLIVSPNVPTFVAPGDEFEITVSVANNLPGSGPDALLQCTLATSGGLEIVERPEPGLVVPEGQEKSLSYRLKALEILGNADLTFTAQTGDESARYVSHLSVCPAAPFLTEVQSGYFSGTSQDVKIERVLHPEFRQLEASTSLLPLSLARGLQIYLDEYPHLCSEQLTSRALPTILMDQDSGLGLPRAQREEAFARILSVLSTRQNAQGAFGLWEPENNLHFDFPSIYVMHLLTEARELEYDVPAVLFQNGLKHLEQIAADSPQEPYQARLQAYAIYLLTRNKVVTTNYLERLREHLKTQPESGDDLASVYCAGAYALLQNQSEGAKLLAQFHLGHHPRYGRYDFYSDLARDSQYLFILSRHFPAQLRHISADDLLYIVTPLSQGEFNTYSAAYAILGLKAYAQAAASGNLLLTLQQKSPGGAWQNLTLPAGLSPRVGFSPDAQVLRFGRHPIEGAAPPRLFYQVITAGFDLKPVLEPVTHGLEVQRDYLRDDKAIGTAALGEEITVRLRLRSPGAEGVSNVAVMDLLPGGFEVVTDSIRSSARRSWQPDYVDVREDRVVLYGYAQREVQEFIYRIKATNRGHYQVPPVQAESMYDRRLHARGLSGTFEIGDEP